MAQTAVKKMDDKKMRALAEQRVVKRTLLLSHITTYIIINAILLVINTLTGGPLWALWSITGWGLALAIHLFAHYGERSSGLAYHAFIYAAVNLFLAFIDFYDGDGIIDWVWYPMAGWGLGLAIHGFAYTSKRGSELSYHIFIYAVVNVFLTAIDYLGDGELNWVIYPIFWWGFAVLVHIIIHVIAKPKKGEDPNKSWLDRKVEQELIKAGHSPLQATVKPATSPNVSQDITTFCPKCGKENRGHPDFCAECGGKF